MDGPSADVLKTENSNLECVCVICDLLKKGFLNRKFREKNDIIKSGRPMVPLNLKTTVDKSAKKFTRYFHVKFYKKYEWLTGCKILLKLFCWPCLLFNTSEKSHWNSVGITDLNNFYKSVKRHVNSKGHLIATVKEKTFGTIQIEYSLNNQLQISNKCHNERVKKNRDILKRLIDINCFLGQHELSFKTHNKEMGFVNRGSYFDIDLLNFLAKYDEIIRNHFIESTVFRDNSCKIQNDLIKCTIDVVMDHIKNEIKKAPFLSIALDEITDIMDLSQLSIVVRYLLDGIPQERFLGFLDINTDRTTEAIFKIVCDIASNFECESKLVAQSYDGAVVLTGHLHDLQAKVKEKFGNAIFVHCLAHRLSFVLSQGMSNIKDCKVFFSTLVGLASFFSKSSKRANTLDIHIQKRFPKVAPTRWNYDGCLVQIVFQYRECLIDFFQDIWDNKEKWDAETITASNGYLHWLEQNFDFNFLLNIFSEIFPHTDILFDVLQTKSNNIDFCVQQIDEFERKLIQKRDQFQYFWDKTKNMDLELQRKKIRLNNIDDRQTYYRRLYVEIFDNILNQLRSRFQNFSGLKFVELCNFSNYNSLKFPTEPFNSLKLNYGNFFDTAALHSQLSIVYDTTELSDKKIPLVLLSFLKTTGLDKSFDEVVKLCQLVSTIPATNASVEQSFSTLKRIKKFISNSTGEDRVSNLALLSIEKDCVKQLSENPKFYDDIIDKYAAIDRLIELNYK